MLRRMSQKLFTGATLARWLGVPTAWLHAEADAGRLPHIKAGNVYLFDAETVERILRERAAKEGLTSQEAARIA